MPDSIFDPMTTSADWNLIEYDPYRPQAASPESRSLAQLALSVLTPSERAVVELYYGFAGDPKTDEEVADVLRSTRGTVKKQRARAMAKMRAALGAE